MSNPFPFAEKTEIDAYSAKYRRSDVPPLEISLALDLFPDHPRTLEVEDVLTWKDPWPFAERAGVYLVYDSSAQLIYIGKARVLGNRMWTYFGGGAECVYREHWGIPPRFVRVVAVPNAMTFEAAALEEYLISRLKPKLNTIGIS